MFNVDLSVDDFEGYAVVALCGELDLLDTPDVASHLIGAEVHRLLRPGGTAACAEVDPGKWG